jgi:ABC-type nitrate/sulfonate/bicarbonate transport system substrate-binding protein
MSGWPWHGGFGAEAPKVRIAYASRSASAMPQYMAVQKGYFKAEGLDVEIIQMNPRLGATAVVNGDVSFATPLQVLLGVLRERWWPLCISKKDLFLLVRGDQRCSSAR